MTRKKLKGILFSYRYLQNLIMKEMKISELTLAMIRAAKKGSNIAMIIRSEDALLHLLVEEKTGNQKNVRFVQDFKTLADVLIQETVRYDLDQKFPGLGKNLYGEESNKFTNALGETICVTIEPDQEKNVELLGQVLHGNHEAARLLAQAISSQPESANNPLLDQVLDEIELDKVRIWIDPIDSTAQYIQAAESKADEHNVISEGLQCVSVLIGVYDVQTGLPIIGVAYQPFHHQEDDGWKSRYIWGICYGDTKVHFFSDKEDSKESGNNVIVTSSSEDQRIQEKLKEMFSLCYAAGAGYKALCVLDDKVDAYLVTKGSTYHWDTCGLHAILMAMGGGIASYKDCVTDLKRDPDLHQIRYNISAEVPTSGIDQWCNSNGVIVYKEPRILQKLQKLLATSGPTQL
ncbi:inositol polyphosphate 1-phosphatase isoform X1 [Octopus bimaculoides]|nr:inositol polyphosphate 1-phosphatase isoform X1 [Octopus bimaculoides]